MKALTVNHERWSYIKHHVYLQAGLKSPHNVLQVNVITQNSLEV